MGDKALFAKICDAQGWPAFFPLSDYKIPAENKSLTIKILILNLQSISLNNGKSHFSSLWDFVNLEKYLNIQTFVRDPINSVFLKKK